MAAAAGSVPLEGQPASYARPPLVTLLAIVHFFWAAILLLITAGCMLFANMADDPAARLALGVVAAIVGTVAALRIACGVGLWGMRPYGRILQIVFAAIGLLGIPFGTLIGILVLIYMMNPGVKLLFSGRPAADFTADEHRLATSAPSTSAVVIGILAVAAVLVVIAGASIVAAIAIPGLLRARVAGNETSARAAIRALQAGEVAYAAANGGYYDSVECLVHPRECLPGYSGVESFVDPSFAASTRGGYVFTFIPGAAADAASAASPISRSSITTYAYVAAPERPRSTGFAVFCGDSSGMVCQLQGTASVTGAQCPPGCDAR